MPATAQDGEEDGVVESRHLFAFFTGNSWIPQGRSRETGKKETVIAPTFGLDYEYRLSEAWAFGSYNALTIVNISVERDEEELVERENTTTFTIGGSCHFTERMKVELSAGVETDAHETLRVGRIAYEYGFEMRKNWELGIVASYTWKDFYDVFGLGLVISKRCGR